MGLVELLSNPGWVMRHRDRSCSQDPRDCSASLISALWHLVDCVTDYVGHGHSPPLRLSRDLLVPRFIEQYLNASVEVAHAHTLAHTGLAALAEGFVEEDGRGGGDVEAIGDTQHGHAHGRTG